MTDSYDRLIDLLCSHYIGDGLALDPKKELVYLIMNHGPQILKYTQTTYVEEELEESFEGIVKYARTGEGSSPVKEIEQMSDKLKKHLDQQAINRAEGEEQFIKDELWQAFIDELICDDKCNTKDLALKLVEIVEAKLTVLVNHPQWKTKAEPIKKKDEFDVWICDWCEKDFEAGVLVGREIPDKKIMGWICPKCKEKDDKDIIKQRRNPVGMT